MSQAFHFQHARSRYDLLVIAETQEEAKTKFKDYLFTHPNVPNDGWSMNICGRLATDVYSLAFFR